MRAKVYLSSTALLNNFHILAKKSAGQMIIPMVKANAYGHGAVWVAKTLLGQAKARKRIFGLGVATFSEALELRRQLPTNTKKVPILIFSDCAPFSNDWLKVCKAQNLEPVLSELRSLLEFQKQNSSVQFHVEVNTGMNRLGIPVDSLSLLQKEPRSVFTHLAESENPKSKLSQKQILEFERVIEWKNLNSPDTLVHFANSGAIWNARQFSFAQSMNMVRPGLSLYGIRPYAKAKNDGLKSVMTFQAPVIQKIFLEKGETVGYGGLYRCNKPQGEWIATLAAGYADGIFRAMANQGPLLGKVSMDLIAISATSKTKIGDCVTLWGEGVDPYEVAARAGTIPYEVTTRIGERVQKVYGK